MNEVKQKLRVFFWLFLLVTTIGTFGFMGLENLSFTEALYYNIVTMSTVGYGDIYPHSPLSRIFTVLLIFAGGGTFLGMIANATELVILKRDFQNRMRKVNMVLGVFFSEIGYKLLGLFSQNDKDIDSVRNDLQIATGWGPEKFLAAKKVLSAASHRRHEPGLPPPCRPVAGLPGTPENAISLYFLPGRPEKPLQPESQPGGVGVT